MKKIKNIVFDFGGVLLDWNPRYFYQSYFDTTEKMDYFLTHICTEEWNAEQDRGRTFAEGIRLLQAQYPEYRSAIRFFEGNWNDMLRGEFPDSVDILHQLKDQGFALYGLTNWSAETFPRVYKEYDFFAFFDGIVVSGEEKLIKPDAAIFNVLLQRYQLKADESIFIDDNYANIQAADALGFKTIHFVNAEKTKEQLQSLLAS